MKSRSAASLAPRLIATVILGAAVAFGTTGCTFITHQATTNAYSASDGVNTDQTGGSVVVRNALVIATEDGSTGNLIGAFINESDESASVKVTIGGEQLVVRVPAGERVSLGADERPLLVESLGAKPGSNIEVLFQAGNDEATPIAVPVLDGTLPEYSDLVPDEKD